MLRAAPGIGAVIGGLWLAKRNSAAGLERIVPIAAGTFGASLLAFSFATDARPAIALLVVAGLGMMIQMASCNTLIQASVDDDKRGRVMGLYALALQGTLPWGSLLAGSAAAAIGVPRTFFLGGALCVVVALVFSRRLSVPAAGEPAEVKPVEALLEEGAPEVA